MTRSAAACVLDPRGIAIVGASNDPTKRGHQTLGRLLADGFPHPISPVNPRGSEVQGLRAYPSLGAIGEPVDLAFIVTPARFAPDIVAEAGQAGIPAAVVIAVGFREIGSDGAHLEEQLIRSARENGVALLGPNTNGVFNVPARLNLLGTSEVPSGRLSLLCQSGNVGLALVSQVKHETARWSASSHTGAVSGPHEVAAAALRHAGVVVVDRSDELVRVADTLLQQPPLSGAGRIAVLADGGGHATIAADALHDQGLTLPTLSEETRRRLRRLLPAAASTTNPIDVAGATDGDPSVFDRCLEVLVVQSAYAYEHPLAHDLLRAANVPVMSSVDLAARCMAALQERGNFLADLGSSPSFEVDDRRSTDEGQRVLTEPEGRRLLEAGGVRLGPWRLAATAAEAAVAAEEFAVPVAIKIVSPDVVHKSDVGGVVLNVATGERARDAFEEIVARVRGHQPDTTIDGVLVTPMAPAGVELLLGALMDPSFGPVLTVGAGGTEVELRRDVTFRALPVSRDELARMLGQLELAPMLRGFRGSEPVAHLALVDLMHSVSTLVVTTPQLLELDLNPVIAHAGGVDAVDVRVVVAEAHLAAGRGPAFAAPG